MRRLLFVLMLILFSISVSAGSYNIYLDSMTTYEDDRDREDCANTYEVLQQDYSVDYDDYRPVFSLGYADEEIPSNYIVTSAIFHVYMDDETNSGDFDVEVSYTKDDSECRHCMTYREAFGDCNIDNGDDTVVQNYPSEDNEWLIVNVTEQLQSAKANGKYFAIWLDPEDRMYLEVGGERSSKDPYIQINYELAQCETGACCEDRRFKSNSEICNYAIYSDPYCSVEGGIGSNVLEDTSLQYCSGSSASCNGVLDHVVTTDVSSCSDSQVCSSGSCQDCQSHDVSVCHDGDSYWEDSCGVLEDKKEECGEISCGEYTNYCDGNVLMQQRSCEDPVCQSGGCSTTQRMEDDAIATCEFGCDLGACIDEPFNPSVYVGEEEVFNESGMFIDEIDLDVSEQIRNYLESCEADENGDCLIPIEYFGQGAPLLIRDINISYLENAECIVDSDCSSEFECSINTCQNYQCVEDLSNCCFENLTQTEWGEWQNSTSCGLDNNYEQVRYAVQYDDSSCGTFENLTVSDFRNQTCDYCEPLIENVTIQDWTNLTTCQINDEYQKVRYLEQVDLNGCYELTNLSSDFVDLVTFNETDIRSCDYCSPNPETTWGDWINVSDCRINDTYLQESASSVNDLNGCFDITHLESDLLLFAFETRNQELTCDYCSPNPSWSNWTDWENSGECLINNSVKQISTRSSYDSNGCFESTNLVGDEFIVEQEERVQYASCDYCVPSVVNGSWGDWQNLTGCQIDDTYIQVSYLSEVDENSCYSVTGDEYDNVILELFNKTQVLDCDYCTPNPIKHVYGGGLGPGGFQRSEEDGLYQCLLNDTYLREENVRYVDNNSCYAQTGLDTDYVDDSVVVANVSHSCDYCEPEIEEVISDCVLGERIVNYSHVNSCCVDTGLDSDCTLPESYIEECAFYNANVEVEEEVTVGEPFTYEINHNCVTCSEINLTIQTPLENFSDTCIVEQNSCISSYEFVSTRVIDFMINVSATSSDGNLSFSNSVLISTNASSCEINSDCSDGNVQTIDTCNANICEFNYPVLERGWNLVSFPYDEVITKNEIRQSCPGVSAYWEFNNRRYRRASEFKPGIGYWIFSRQRCEMDIDRELTPLTKLNNTYQRGWNLVGTPKSGLSVADFPCEYTNISWGWDRRRFTRINHLEPNEGYWIYLPQGCQMVECSVDLDCGDPSFTSSCEGDGFAEYTVTPTCVENVCEIVEEREITGMCAARSVSDVEVSGEYEISSTSIKYYRDFEERESDELDLEVFCDGSIVDHWIEYEENSYDRISIDEERSSVVYTFEDRSYSHGLDATLYASCDGEAKTLAIVDYRGNEGKRLYLDMTCEETLLSGNNYWHANGYEEEMRTYSSGVKYVYHPINGEDDYFLYAEGELVCS